MKRLRLTSAIITICFIVFQISEIFEHHQNRHEITADTYLFLKHFELLFVSRTLKHEKGIYYWFDWIDNEAGLVTMNKTMSLLHFDVHGIEDNSDEPIHICTAPNLFVYDFFVKQALDTAYNSYFGDFNPKENGNVTRHAFRKGYVKDIVWIYPNHWNDYSENTVLNTSMQLFQQMIEHQTYYINPKERQLSYLQNNVTNNTEIWKTLFDEHHRFKSVQNQPSKFDNLEINIWVLSLKEYLNEPYFKNLNINNVILDIDLDFFICQEPAQTYMNHFDWNEELVTEFNNILSHHQYIPSHMFSEYSNEAIMTLLYLLNEDKTEILHINGNNAIPNLKYTMPQIEDVFQIAIQEKMGISTIKRLMYLLYEYQIERTDYDSKDAQHLLHFDNMFQILNIAHRRLMDMDIIAYKDSEEALHGIRVADSSHMKHLFQIAKAKAKKEYFIAQNFETTKLKEIMKHKEGTHRIFAEFANKLINIHKHRNLISAEMDEMAQQKGINYNLNEQNLPQTEWSDEQLKELMNMTTDYLYHDWRGILFNESNDNSWKHNYPQWISAQMEDIDTDADILKFVPNEFAPYNQDKDHSKMHRKINENDAQQNQDRFALYFDTLDPLQQHFVKRANHTNLKSFVDKLSKKQSMFLQWLIFCYYNQVKCRGRKYFPRAFNKSKHFGYDFVWTEINGWPHLIENSEKSEMLQLEIFRYHSQFTTFIPAKSNEIMFIPNATHIQIILNEFEQMLSRQNTKIVTVGMELSPAHIPKEYRHNIDCKLYKLIENTMFQKIKPCFVRLKKMEYDYIVPYTPCAII